ncbi:MAG: hypothetical protein RSA79_04790 [Oscillospiraceae bacterium]
MNNQKNTPNLKNISEEYFLSAKKVKTRMDELRKKMNATKNADDKIQLNHRINLLTTEYYQLIEVANYLSAYYS